MGKIDDNREYVGLVYDESDIQVLKVDPVTGRLLIDIETVTSTTPSANARAKIDENQESISEVVDDNGEIRPLLIDNRNGKLFVEFTM